MIKKIPVFLFFTLLFCKPEAQPKKPLSLTEDDTTVYLTAIKKQKNRTIPKKVHQIWFGSSTPPGYYNIYKKSFAKDTDYSYRFWNNDDLTEKNFPLTYKYMLKIVAAGIKKYGKNNNNWKGCPSKKLSEIADLAKFELIYHHGGYYFDAKGELIKSLNDMQKETQASFITANEQPCGFHCTNKAGHYISTAFFAAAPKSPILKLLLSKELLDKIDPDDPRANIQTGPTFFAQAFIKEIRENPSAYGVLMLKTKQVYPITFPTKTMKDLCLSTDRNSLNKNKKSHQKIEHFMHKGKKIYTIVPCENYPEAIIMFHLTLGGTWLT